MVDPGQLAFDIVGNTVTLLLPAGLWALLFLLVWEHTPFAESIGFGRWAFWLLLPGALLASFALLPIAPVSYDWVAVSFGGAIFPLLVGALAFGRAAPPRRRSLAWFLSFLAVESAILLVLVLPVSQPIVNGLASGGIPTAGAQILLVALATAILSGVALVVFGRIPQGPADEPTRNAPRVIGFTLALTGGVLASTFAMSAAIPGVGIVEQFPEYLLPPIAAGLVAAALASRVFPGREGFALPISYFASTFGVLLGADLLRQPPLYGTGPAGLYTIGGAGVLDLVYLSGFLAFGAAYLGHIALGRGLEPVTPIPPEALPTPIGLLGRSFRAGVRGDLAGSMATADLAGREAAAQAHRLLDLPPAPPDRPWEGLPVPGWVVADQANLTSVARAGASDPREGFRAWLTARWLVLLGRELGFRRFATIGSRTVAFLLDLLIMVLPATAVWVAITVTTPGTLDDLLTNIGFNAAIYGFVAVAFLYLALSETVFGTTPGKRLCGLVVRDRQMQPPGLSASLVRNVSLLPILTVVALGGAWTVAFALKFSGVGILSVSGIALAAGVLALVALAAILLGGIAFLGALGVLVIAVTAERQRVGDLWAGTWVVRASAQTQPPTPVAPSVAPSPPVPSGPGRTS